MKLFHALILILLTVKLHSQTDSSFYRNWNYKAVYIGTIKYPGLTIGLERPIIFKEKIKEKKTV
jgi:hypothetical protein